MSCPARCSAPPRPAGCQPGSAITYSAGTTARHVACPRKAAERYGLGSAEGGGPGEATAARGPACVRQGSRLICSSRLPSARRCLANGQVRQLWKGRPSAFLSSTLLSGQCRPAAPGRTSAQARSPRLAESFKMQAVMYGPDCVVGQPNLLNLEAEAFPLGAVHAVGAERWPRQAVFAT